MHSLVNFWLRILGHRRFLKGRVPSRRKKQKQSVARHIDQLEDRTLLVVNLIATEAWLVDDLGTRITSPINGQNVVPQANWNITGATGPLNYDVEYALDGVAVYRGPTNFGSAFTDSFWSWYRGAGYATPGTHTVRITLDPFNTVAESNEADNVYQFSFTTNAASPPSHVFNLNGSLDDYFGVYSLSSAGGTQNPMSLTFGPNQGPFGSLGVYDNYTLAMRVSLDSVAGTIKLLDFNNRTTNLGLYLQSGQLRFLGATGVAGPTLTAGTAATVVLTRDGASKVVTGYVDGTTAFTFTDSNSIAVLSGPQSVMHFLRDDTVTGTDAGAGQLDYIKVFNAALSAAQVQELPNSDTEQSGDPAFRANPGFATTTLPRGDDNSSTSVNLGFAINFFGTSYNSLFVNNNGNVTFSSSLSGYTPQPIVNNQRVLIAPFWADVDTNNSLSGRVTYGQSTVDGRPAFGINWKNVGYYSSKADKLNDFQLVIIDRSDIAVGNFDFEMNYTKIQWEAGSASGGTNGLGGSTARAGYSNGSTTSFELPGSDVDGAFLDSGPANTRLISNSFNSEVDGRYRFQVRNGVVQPDIAVFDNSTEILDNTGSVNFGTLAVGATPPTRTFTIRNTGPGDLTLGTISLPVGYTLVSSPASVVAPLQQTTFVVRLETTTPGNKSGMLSIATNDSDENPFNFHLNGTVAQSEIEVLDGLVNIPDNTGAVLFDSVRQGDVASSRTFTIRNTGLTDLTLGSVVATTGFTVTSQPTSIVGPGLSTSFSIRLNSTTLGNSAGTISFTTNDPDESPFNFSVSGFVYSNVDLVITDIQVTPAAATSGDTIQIQWTVRNQGTGAFQGTFQDELLLSSDTAVGSDDSLGRFAFTGNLPAGGTTTRTQSIVLGANLAGSRFVIVRADQQGQVAELVETNNVRVDDTPIQITAPDLVVTSVSAPTVVNSGQQTEVHWVITNQGAGATRSGAAWQDRVYLSTDATWDAGDTSVGVTANFSALGVSESYNNQLTVTIPYGTQGIFYLIVRTDPDQQIAEGIEANNTRSAATNVLWNPPDLRVTNVVSQMNAFAGQTTRVAWDVRNQGTGPTRETSWSDRVWLSTDTTLTAADILVGTYSHSGALAVNETYTQTQFVTVPLTAQGTYYVIVETDGLQQVLEGPFNGNNTGFDSTQTTVLQLPPPDLEVIQLEAPDQGFARNSMTLNYTVMNAGNTATLNGSWTDRFYLSSDTTLDAGDRSLGIAAHTGILGAGSSYSGSPTFVLPSDLTGTFFVLVRTDVFGDVFGDNRTNNDRFDATPIVISPAPSDLTVTSIGIPEILVSGSSLTVNYRVENEGQTATNANNWTDQFYLSVDTILDDSDRLVGAQTSTGPLLPGTNYQSSRTFTLPADLVGSFYVLVRTDSTNQVFELQKGNNVRASAQRVNLVPPPADLTVNEVQIPTSARAGSSFELNYRVENTGPRATENVIWTDRIYLSNNSSLDASDILLETLSGPGSLAPGQAYSPSPTLTLPTGLSGSYFILVVTDSSDSVFELDQADNVRASTSAMLVVNQPADFIVSSISAPATSFTGAGLRVDWTVRNQGIGNSIQTTWRDRIYISNDAVFDASDRLLLDSSYANLNSEGEPVPLGVGESVARTALVTTTSDDFGTRFLFVVTDATNRVFEGTLESNNVSAGQVVTLTRLAADLQVTDVLAPPTTALAGTPFSLTWTVQNFGNATTNSNYWYDTVYLSTDANFSADDISLGPVRRSSPLASLEQYTTTSLLTSPLGLTGDFFLIVQTDSTKLVQEFTQEGNNVRTASTRLSLVAGPAEPTPNLIVTAIDAPTQSVSGQPLRVSWTVQNTGDPLVNRTWYDAVYLSLDTVLDRRTDHYLGFQERTTSLTTGASTTFDGTFQVPSSLFGSYFVLIAVDSGSTIREGAVGELDNTGVSPFAVAISPTPPADLVVGTITIPASGVSGQVANITYTVSNQGSVVAVGQWTDSLYLSTDNAWDISDTFVGRVLHVGDLAVGGSYTQTLSTPLPGVVPGDYHLIVRSDIRNQVFESNEVNNIRATLNQFDLDVPSIALGSSRSGNLTQGQSVYYQVSVAAGESLIVEFDAVPSTGFVELAVSSGEIPTRTHADASAIVADQPDQRVVISSTTGETYYILAYGNQIEGTAAYTIRARTVQFDVFDTNYGLGGTAGTSTIEINGAKLDGRTSAALTAANGSRISAIDYFYESDTRIYATFDLRQVSPGLYNVEITNSNGQTKSITGGFTVQRTNGQPTIHIGLDAPNRVRRNIDYGITLHWENDTLNDVQAPLFTIGNSVPFGLTPGDTSVGSRFTFLGTNTHGGPAGFLRPGQSESLTLYSHSDADPGEHDLFVDQLGTARGDAFDWNDVRSSVESNNVNGHDFDSIFGRMQERIGGTWGDYLNALTRAATLMPDSLGDNRNVSALLRLEYLRAAAEFSSSVSGRGDVVDLTHPIGGLAITATDALKTQGLSTSILNDGSFVFPQIPAGVYTFQINGRDAFVNGADTYTVANGVQSTGLTVTPVPGGSVYGRLQNSQNEPLAGTEIQFFDAAGVAYLAITDLNGRFALQNVPAGTYEVTADPEGTARLLSSITIVVGRNDFQFTPAIESTIGGTVLVGGVAPTDEPYVVATRPGGTASERIYQGFLTGNQFTIPGLPAGTFDLYIISGPHARRINNITVAEGEHLALGNLEAITPEAGQVPPSFSPRGILDEFNLQVQLAEAEIFLTTVFIPAINTRFGLQVGDLWEDFLFSSSSSPRSRTFTDGDAVVEGNIFEDGFREDLQVDQFLEDVLFLATEKIQDQFIRGQLTCGQFQGGEKEIDVTTLLSPAELSRAIDFSNPYSIPGNIAGGPGEWKNKSGVVRPDRRFIDGKVVVRLATESMIFVESRLRFVVEDAIDFEPGNITGGIERIFTVKLDFLENHDRAYGVPYVAELHDKPGRFLPIGIPEQVCAPPAPDSPPEIEHPIDRPISVDPNDIIGPIGFGPENWISAQQPLQYTIRFENDPELATAAAQVVRITQTLDSDLDPRSFRLGDLGFGDVFIDVPENQSFYTTRLDLTASRGIYVDVFAGIDVTRGEIFWSLTSIDPATGDVPSDPNLGLLPLNLMPPEGDGFVSYTVRAKSTAITGTRIDAQARIVFDINEPIDTPAIFNTLDLLAPASTVAALPAQPNNLDGRYIVRWTGTDDVTGSSLNEYDIYVATDDGPFQLWLSGTTLTEAEFAGPVGHEYSFYSVARDFAGNSELPPADVDAQTVVGNRAPQISAATFTIPENTGNAAFVGIVSATDADPGDTWTFSILAGNTEGAFSIDPFSGNITVADQNALNFETHSSFELTIQATDNGTPAASGTSRITIELSDVNEAPVIPAGQEFEIRSNVAAGTNVGLVQVEEPDLAAPNRALTYSLTGGNSNGVFAIDPSTGQITVNQSAVLATLGGQDLTLEVTVVDGGDPALSATQTVNLNVIPVNTKPLLTNPGPSPTYNGRQKTPVKLFPTLTIHQETGAPALASIALYISKPKARKNPDFLNFNGVGLIGIREDFDLGNRMLYTITLRPNVTNVSVQSILRSISFSTKGAGLRLLSRDLHLSVTDQSGTSSDFLTQTVNVRKR